MTDGDAGAYDRERLKIRRRDLERRINPLVAKQEQHGSEFTDAELDELRNLRREKAAVERQLRISANIAIPQKPETTK